tara:strand:+ start:317 stop:505 length:189 start_codon:yes stop_codon:yes gene_type:complete
LHQALVGYPIDKHNIGNCSKEIQDIIPKKIIFQQEQVKKDTSADKPNYPVQIPMRQQAVLIF